jgi:hypothetical protein
MEQTTTKPATAPPKTPETAINAGAPPGATNGTLNGAAPATATAPQPAVAEKALQLGYKVLLRLADLRITVCLFALAMLIVFWGTLAQQDYGVWTVVTTYFRSYLLWVPLRVVLFTQIEDNGMSLPFPGGWSIGIAMLVNLLAAHAIRFKLTWNRGGIILIHVGIIIMMLGEFITGTFAIEGSIQVKEGMSTNYVTHHGSIEFAVIKNINAANDKVVTVPRKFLTPGAVIDDPRLPFIVEVTEYMVNSDVRGRAGAAEPDARGHARIYVANKLDEVSGVNPKQTHDAPSMYVVLVDRNTKERTKWLFSALLENQWVAVKEKNGDTTTYNVNLRFKQSQRDFTIHLDKFTHDTYPSTGIVKDFHSYIRLTDEKAGIIERPEEIYMNSPMSYQGLTFYQQGWTTDQATRKIDGTILQVVHNPGWALPYISCLVVGLGLLYHFGITLYKFVDRRIVR